MQSNNFLSGISAINAQFVNALRALTIPIQPLVPVMRQLDFGPFSEISAHLKKVVEELPGKASSLVKHLSGNGWFLTDDVSLPDFTDQVR